MKPEFREKLAQLPFEEKIRKVGELIQLSRKIKAQRDREDARNYPQSAIARTASEEFKEMKSETLQRLAQLPFEEWSQWELSDIDGQAERPK